MSTIPPNPPPKSWLTTYMYFFEWRTKVVIISVVILILVKLAVYKVLLGPSFIANYKHASLDDALNNVQKNSVSKNISYTTGKENTNDTYNTRSFHYITNYTVVGNNRYFIYSVQGELSLQTKHWTSIVFNGWEVLEKPNRTPYVPYICCLKFDNGVVQASKISGVRPSRFGGAMQSTQMQATQILCDIRNSTLPNFAALVLKESRCYKKPVFHRPEYNKVVEEPAFAITAKLAYGSKDAGEIIEFMEYHLYYGARPILIYQYYDLNMEARKVLQYYVQNGDLEVITFPKVPLLDIYHRRLDEVSPLADNDLQITIFDAQQRLRCYKYFTSMDTDEFIVPGKNITNFVQLMDTLVEKHSTAASFQMLSEIHLQDWEPTNNESRLMIGRYGYHTQPTHIAPKSIYLLDRVVPGTVRMHGAVWRAGYKRIVLGKEEAVLKHFRKCKDRWFTENKPCKDFFKKLRGHFMDNFVDKIRESVLKVKQIVGVV